MLHFYHLEHLQEAKTRRQMTNLQFLFHGKENDSYESRREMYSITLKQPCQYNPYAPSLLPCQHPCCTTCPTLSISERATAAQQNSPVCSLPHCRAHSLLTRQKTASPAHKTRIGDGLIGIHLTDRTSSLH